MKQIFFTLSLITFSMQSMQNPDKKDALIKWSLLHFISKADVDGVFHLIDNGATSLIDQEVAKAANDAYNAHLQKTNKISSLWSPEGTIYCKIEDIFNPKRCPLAGQSK